ncbi:MAG: FkbM family methyltransferase, partial [Cytophagaceae bacterium]
PGESELHVSDDHVLSSFSNSFRDKTTQSGRFAGVRWERREICEIITMDALIEAHGRPRFVKIDVEGFESEVLAGLTTAVPALSVEWVPELPENAEKCIRRLMELGDYEFHMSFGERMTFSRKEWRTHESMLNLIEELRDETSLFGDIYARLKS